MAPHTDAPAQSEPAEGNLGIVPAGLEAVGTEFMPGVEAVRRGLAQPVASLPVMARIRLGRRADGDSPKRAEFVALRGREDLDLGGLDTVEENRGTPYQGGGSSSERSNGAAHGSVVHRNNEADQNRTAVERPPLFSGMPADNCKEMFAAARVKEFTRGDMLYIEGDSVQQVILLTTGSVKITQLGLSGAEVILRLGVPGDVIGAVDLFSIGRHCTTAQAFRLCRALVWDAPAFRALVERFPVLRQNMVRILGEHLRELEERFREVATERVGPRLARQLVRLLEKIGRPIEGAVEIALSREELAQMTGTTLFTVSRLLSAWEARGMVRPRREAVAICDVQSLRAVSQES